MSKLSLCEIQQSQLDKTPIVDGQLVCCLDTGNTYRDTAGGRVRIGSDLERVSELPLAPLAGKIYYLPPGDLYIYNSGWVMLNTDTWRGIQNNLTSDSTTDSLSAAQGKALKALVDGKAPTSHTHSQYYDSTISRTKGTVLAAPASANGVATFRTLTKSDVGLGSVDNTADSAKSVKAATKLQTYKQGSTTETYGDSYPLYAQWSGNDVVLKCDNYNVCADRASVSNTANAVAWGNVTGKPSTFTPSSHTHNYAGSSSAGGAATSANKVNAALTINLNGTSQGAWDGSSAKSISITAASVGATSVTISRW